MDNNISLIESPYIDKLDDNDEESHILNNYDGWVNPEDLGLMPQCILKQDHSTWLAAMTACTAKKCTSHFGLICTHHQWLTELRCLSTELSPDLLKTYLPYCSRSVLSKAQLYLWIRDATLRTWLVNDGDANELQELSAASLVEGYADLGVIDYAPTCLIDSVAAQSREPYSHVMASCMFTGSAQTIGDANRPWEYSESQQSLVALAYETVGYDLTGSYIDEGMYFDKNCFCSFFAVDPENEPCSGSLPLDLTKERLWFNATCGSSSLPEEWTDTLQTTDFDYIPLEDWRWPLCVADMPEQVTGLPDQCAAEACELDADGYCREIKPAVDRACFCVNISYDSCGGSCQVFETRIDYVKWLHNICGELEDWHGLDDWRRLASPTSREIIPWGWTVKSSNTTRQCASNGWKLGSLAIVNYVTLLVILQCQIDGLRGIVHRFRPRSWFFRGFLIAACQIIANYNNAFGVQRIPGYEDVPTTQLLLLWCTTPRLLTWLPILLLGLQPFETINLSAAGSCLLAEVILQGFSSYYMLMTIQYGIEHNFYFGGGLENAERPWMARMMYHGALMWLMLIGLVLALLVWAAHRINQMSDNTTLEPPPPIPKRDRKRITTFVEGIRAHLNECYTQFKGKAIHFCMVECMGPNESLLIRNNGSAYGTFSESSQNHWASQPNSLGLYAALILCMLLLWLAQWLFWTGFVFVSSEEYALISVCSLNCSMLTEFRYCPPQIASITAVWILFSSAAAILGAP